LVTLNSPHDDQRISICQATARNVLWHFAEKINNKHHMIKSMTVAPRRAVIFSPSTQVRRIKSVGSSARRADIASFIIHDEQEVCTVNSSGGRHSPITMQSGSGNEALAAEGQRGSSQLQQDFDSLDR
jgi:hypothetical protein